VLATLLLGKILAVSGKKKQAEAVLQRVFSMKEVGTAEKSAAEEELAALHAR
jgi:hypothetical protein